MDFMRVLDQTVREIKREVNLKVLKVPEIEQKVLDATSDEPWGPHGSVLSEIASATKKLSECQMIMNVLWTRLSDTGANWRHVYKSLAVMEYLVANGSDHALEDIIDRNHRIAAISDFQYVEPNGKDVGINVRKKVETILAILTDREKIQEVRNKASANRDKYFGLSSSGVTFKSSSSSLGGVGSDNGDHYGSLSSEKVDSLKDKYGETEQYEDNESSSGGRESRNKLREMFVKQNDENKSQKGVRSHTGSKGTSSIVPKLLTKLGSTAPTSSSHAIPSEDDFDDFDPRGTSTLANAGINQVDLFGSNLVDIMDDTTPLSAEKTSLDSVCPMDADIFADATFISAPSHSQKAVPQTEDKVDLFATQPTNSAAIPDVDFFAEHNPRLPSGTKASISESTNAGNSDPFASIPLNNFEESDVFGAFTSHLNPSPESSNNHAGTDIQEHASSSSSIPAAKKGGFQVKSGIWADSLSRGLIDVNITAPKKASLSDIGIAPRLGDGDAERQKGPPGPIHMGRSMGMGPGAGMSGFTSAASGGSGGSFSSLMQ